MKCREVEALLTESLMQAHTPEIRRHLSDCSACQRLRRELEAIEFLNFSLARMAGAPVDFSQRVTRLLRERRWRQTSWTVVATVAVLVIGLAGIMLVQVQYPSDQEPSFAARKDQPVGPYIGTPSVILGDPSNTMDLEEQYLEVILGEPLRGLSARPGVPAEIKVHRTDMGRVNLTHVSH